MINENININRFTNELSKISTDVSLCGSRVTLKTPRPDSDWDILVYCNSEDEVSEVVAFLQNKYFL